MALHLLATQRRVMQHLLTAFRIGVEHHALAEDGRHERIGLGLVQVFVAGAEEELVGLGAGKEDDLLVGELEGADVPALRTDALHQCDGIGAELFEMAVLVLAAGDPGNGGRGHEGIPSSPSSSFCLSAGASLSGASGCTSISGICAPRGVSATKVTARAISEGRRK
ncbi:Uncharacterised protein [Mycobacteroides abscessus subsp. massiliense]|nr:Uncharacterised protein [Mycobacteroides abscessus subsp. massiliense]